MLVFAYSLLVFITAFSKKPCFFLLLPLPFPLLLCTLPSDNIFPSLVLSALLSTPIYRRAITLQLSHHKKTPSECQTKLRLIRESKVFLLDQNKHIKAEKPIHQHLFPMCDQLTHLARTGC